MKRTYELSDEAEAQIDEIYEYTLEKWGETQADQYVGGLILQIEKRAENPKQATNTEPGLAARLDAPDEAVRSFLYEKHRCYFSYNEKVLRVLLILHGAIDKEARFRDIEKTSKS